jgi:hypothetical protein
LFILNRLSQNAYTSFIDKTTTGTKVELFHIAAIDFLLRVEIVGHESDLYAASRYSVNVIRTTGQNQNISKFACAKEFASSYISPKWHVR